MSAARELAGPIVFFGDSLTDNGNLFAAARGVIDPKALGAAFGPGGRVSDGPTYAERVDDLLGLPPSANYAVAGAGAVGRQRLRDYVGDSGYADDLIVPPIDPRLDFDMNLGAQVDRFAADAAGVPLDDATGFILIGGNDLRAAAGGFDLPATLAGVVGATLGAATDLIGLGMGAVVIATLPRPAFFPAYDDLDPVEKALAAAAFGAHAAALAAGVEALQLRGHDVRLLPMGPISRAIAEDPSAFGLIARDDLTLRTGDAGDLARYDADQVAFWDPLHPSAATHGILGAYTAFALERDPVALGRGADGVTTGDGRDLVFGLGGGDAIALGGGADLGFGGSGRDTILGGLGADLLSGGSGADVVRGGNGRDVLGGGEGADLLSGGGSGDVLIDGLGGDLCYGGRGDDRFLFVEAELIGGTTGTDADAFRGGDGFDTLWLALDEATAAALGGALTGPEPRAALAALGIEAASIEAVKVVAGRAGLAALSDQGWYEQADLWGLV